MFLLEYKVTVTDRLRYLQSVRADEGNCSPHVRLNLLDFLSNGMRKDIIIKTVSAHCCIPKSIYSLLIKVCNIK